ncbi:MAG: glutathione S-transferase family protein [Byssovorax sp.]
MALEVFWGSGSGPAWRVLLALAIKGVPYDSRLLSFSKAEHRTPELLAISPRGKVPVIRDGDFALNESLAILAYLDRKHPTPPLFGKTAEETGTIIRVIMDHEAYGAPAIELVTRPLLFGKLDEQRAAVTEALPGLRDELARLTKQLGARSFLVGDTISAADVFVFPMIKTIERALGKPGAETLDHGLRPLGGAHPELAAWAARIEALPGYDATFPPHWREG